METIKKLRKAFNVTQSELAKRAGLSRTAISMFESGQRQPSQEQYDRMLEAVAPMDTPVKNLKEAQALLDVFNFSPREIAYLFFTMQMLNYEDYSENMTHKEAERLLEFLKTGTALRREVKVLEKELTRFDAYNVYQHRGIRTSIKVERCVTDDGKEIFAPIIGRTLPDKEKNEEQERLWVDLNIRLTYRSKCIEALLQDKKYSHFVLDYTQGSSEEELKEKYHIAKPREKMIELIMKYIHVNRFAWG